jgi:nucleoside-diphosphate-sugar epimerase
MASEKKTVLLTGATGFVGGQCRKFWGDKYKLILADNRPMSEAKDSSRTEGGGDTSLAAHESFTLLDITVYEDFLAACQGVDTVVHLAATPGAPDDPEGFYGSLLPLNVTVRSALTMPSPPRALPAASASCTHRRSTPCSAMWATTRTA